MLPLLEGYRIIQPTGLQMNSSPRNSAPVRFGEVCLEPRGRNPGLKLDGAINLRRPIDLRNCELDC
jgi:hypothetical protein